MINLLRSVFEKNIEKTAYISAGESITYGELWDRAQLIGGKLSGKTTPVIIRGNKESFVLCAILGCIMASRPYIPFNDSLPETRLEKIRSLSAADIISKSDDFSSGKRITDFKNNDGDIAYIIYTSGSSGEPKGVPISRGNLKAFLGMLMSIDAVNNCSGKTVLNQAKFSFDLSVCDIYFSLCTASTLFALTEEEQSKPDLLLKSLAESNASLAVMTPTFAKYCLCLPEFCEDNMPELSCIFFCGEILEAKTVKKLFSRFKNLRIINAYGPTEATCAVCGVEIVDGVELCDPLPCGNINNSSCSINISDGEITLYGPSVFNGYFGGEKINGAYFTGDRGEIKNNLLYCLGRKYGYIKYKGHRIEPDEIKTALLGIEGVEQAGISCVVNSGGQVMSINAAVTVSEPITETELRRRLKLILPDYMLPKSIKIKDNITFNGNFKQDF